MSWSKEDRLIIDNVLNRIARAIRQIEQEEKQARNQDEIPRLSLIGSPQSQQDEAA